MKIELKKIELIKKKLEKLRDLADTLEVVYPELSRLLDESYNWNFEPLNKFSINNKHIENINDNRIEKYPNLSKIVYDASSWEISEKEKDRIEKFEEEIGIRLPEVLRTFFYEIGDEVPFPHWVDNRLIETLNSLKLEELIEYGDFKTKVHGKVNKFLHLHPSLPFKNNLISDSYAFTSKDLQKYGFYKTNLNRDLLLHERFNMRNDIKKDTSEEEFSFDGILFFGDFCCVLNGEHEGKMFVYWGLQYIPCIKAETNEELDFIDWYIEWLDCKIESYQIRLNYVKSDKKYQYKTHDVPTKTTQIVYNYLKSFKPFPIAEINAYNIELCENILGHPLPFELKSLYLHLPNLIYYFGPGWLIPVEDFDIIDELDGDEKSNSGRPALKVLHVGYREKINRNVYLYPRNHPNPMVYSYFEGLICERLTDWVEYWIKKWT